MEILINESIDSLREALGYDEWDEGNDDELLFRQGYEATPIVVEDGEFFDIPDNYEGQIIDEAPYFIEQEIFDDFFEKQPVFTLAAGAYRLEGDLIIPIED